MRSRWVGRNSGPILQTKIHQIKYAGTGETVVCNAISIQCFVPEISVIKLRSCPILGVNCDAFGPCIFCYRGPKISDPILEIKVTIESVKI